MSVQAWVFDKGDRLRSAYRWWTVSASRDHLKLGPVTFWHDEAGTGVSVLCRWFLERTP